MGLAVMRKGSRTTAHGRGQVPTHRDAPDSPVVLRQEPARPRRAQER